MAALSVPDAGIIFLSCDFFFLSFSFLISAIADWMSTIFHSWCGLSANLGCKSETRLAGNAGRKKIAKNSRCGHHCRTLSGYIFATKARIDDRKKTCYSNISAHFLTIWWTSAHKRLRSVGEFGVPQQISTGFRILAALLHGTPVVGVSQTLRRWTEGATCIRQGGHHVGHCPTF